MIQQEAQITKLAWQIFGYSNRVICNDSAIHCGNTAFNNDVQEESVEKTGTVQASPNPVSSLLHLQFKDIEPGNYNILIVNREGVTVLQKTNVYCDNSSVVNLNVSGLFAGFYLIRISNGTKIMEQKILKE